MHSSETEMLKCNLKHDEFSTDNNYYSFMKKSCVHCVGVRHECHSFDMPNAQVNRDALILSENFLNVNRLIEHY